LSGLLLVPDNLQHDLGQMIQQLRFRFPQRGLIGQLEEVPDHFTAFTVQSPKRQPDLHQALKDLVDFLRQNEARKMDQDRRPETGSDVGRATGKVTELRVKCERKSLRQFSVQRSDTPPGGVQREPRIESLNPEVVLLVDHDSEGAPKRGGASVSGTASSLLTRCRS